jgi:hypothetical protein
MPSAASLLPINDKPSSSSAEPDNPNNGELSGVSLVDPQTQEISNDLQQKQKSQTNFPSPIQQAIDKILLIMEHKIRNLEKRKVSLRHFSHKN